MIYRSFTIKNFRGLKDLTIDGLERINLIAGKNNVGKTALLEALWIHHGANNPELGLRVDSFRGLEAGDPENFMGNLFFDFKRDLVIELSAKGDWGNEARRLKMSLQDRPTVEIPLPGFRRGQPDTQQNSSRNVVMDYSYESGGRATSTGRLMEHQINPEVPGVPGIRTVGMELTQQPRPHLPSAIFLSARRASVSGEDVKRYSQLEINGQQEGALHILKEIDSRLTKLAVVSAGQTPAIYADIGLSRLIPVQLMGDGMTRILSLALSIASVPDGMVLVDEIESGLHHSVMQRVWSAIAAFARRYNVQLFATTHSHECFRAAHQAFDSEEDDDFRFYRIDHFKGALRTVMYDREMIGTALEFGLEAR